MLTLFGTGCGASGDSASDSRRVDPSGASVQKAVWLPDSISDRAATYVGDEACASCHGDLVESYHQTNKSRSIARFDPATAPEQFGGEAVVYNEATNLYYEAFVRDGALYQREFRKGPDGAIIHEREHKATYVIGSGNATRSYLMEVNGYLTEMPLTWYVDRERWDMSPGYEAANDRFSRKINLECMTCHNGPPAHTLFTQNHYTNVPLGITCERCHGPASQHVAAREAGVVPDTNRADPTIVNPADLGRRAQLAVCQQCHLAGIAVFEPGEDPTTFRPGQLLRTNRAVFVPKKQITDPEWVGIDSHPIRLARSACFKNSDMTCVTCHDSHTPADQIPMAEYNATCQSCHDGTKANGHVCTRDAAASAEAAMTGNCVSCHMQKGGTSDVPHVTFTDHWIRARPGPRRDPDKGRPAFDTPEPLELVALRRMDRLTGQAPSDTRATVAYFRFYETMHRQPKYIQLAIERGRKATRKSTVPVEMQINLARALAEADSLDAAARVMHEAVAADPGGAWAHYWRGVMEEGRGRTQAAIRAFRKAVSIQPKMVEAQVKLADALYRAQRFDEALDRLDVLVNLDPVHAPKAWFNMGVIRLQRGDPSGARTAFERAASLDPDLVQAHIQLGTLQLKGGQLDSAAQHFRNAIIADPQDPSAYGSLGMVYLQAGQPEVARRLFEKVLALDPDNQNARQLLQRLQEQ